MVSLAFRLAPPWGYFNPALYLFSILFSTHCTGSQWKHWRRGARCSYTRLVHQEQQGENTSFFQILEWRILAHVLQTILLLFFCFFLRTNMWVARQKWFRWRWRRRRPIFGRKSTGKKEYWCVAMTTSQNVGEHAACPQLMIRGGLD